DHIPDDLTLVRTEITVLLLPQRAVHAVVDTDRRRTDRVQAGQSAAGGNDGAAVFGRLRLVDRLGQRAGGGGVGFGLSRRVPGGRGQRRPKARAAGRCQASAAGNVLV